MRCSRLAEPSIAPFCSIAYLHPRPRLALAPALRDHAAAAMDISDGFVGDIAKMLQASGVGGDIDLDAVPLSDAARAAIVLDPRLRGTALTGGDDYEISAPRAGRPGLRCEAPWRRGGVAADDRRPRRRGRASRACRAGSLRSLLSAGSFSHF